MNQTRSRGVFLLVQGVESELGVVGQESGLHGDELTANGILKGVAPIDHAQDVGRQADGHRSRLDTLHNIFNERLTGCNTLVILTLRESVWQGLIQELEETG